MFSFVRVPVSLSQLLKFVSLEEVKERRIKQMQKGLQTIKPDLKIGRKEVRIGKSNIKKL